MIQQIIKKVHTFTKNEINDLKKSWMVILGHPCLLTLQKNLSYSTGGSNWKSRNQVPTVREDN